MAQALPRRLQVPALEPGSTPKEGATADRRTVFFMENIVRGKHFREVKEVLKWWRFLKADLKLGLIKE